MVAKKLGTNARVDNYSNDPTRKTQQDNYLRHFDELGWGQWSPKRLGTDARVGNDPNDTANADYNFKNSVEVSGRQRVGNRCPGKQLLQRHHKKDTTRILFATI